MEHATACCAGWRWARRGHDRPRNGPSTTTSQPADAGPRPDGQRLRHDIDAHYARAVAEGARIVMELEDMFCGDRRYEATDLEGHRWHFGERLSHVRERLDQS